MKTRWVIGALGVVAMGIGLTIMLTDPYIRDPLDVGLWLAGAVVLHDGVLVPVVLAIGVALRRLPVRGVLRGGLIVAGALTAVALPELLDPEAPANPSVRPLDYMRNWVIALAVVAAVTALAMGVQAVRARRASGRAGVGVAGERPEPR
jgi:hypothetical protein